MGKTLQGLGVQRTHTAPTPDKGMPIWCAGVKQMDIHRRISLQEKTQKHSQHSEKIITFTAITILSKP